MGVSSNAYLVYGFDLGEDSEYNVMKRLCQIDENLNEDCDYQECLEEYCSSRGVNLTYYCHCNYPMHIIGIGKQFGASRGFYCQLPDVLPTPAEDIQRLKDVAKELGYDDAHIGWKLVSWSDF